MPDAVQLLAQLPLAQLETLADGLHNQWITLRSSRSTLASRVGAQVDGVLRIFEAFSSEGFTEAQACLLLRSLVATRKTPMENHTLVDLVLSGPDVPGIPTSATEAVVQSLFQEATTKIVLAGYAFHNARPILERLAKRMEECPTLRVLLHVDISRPYRDTSTNGAIIARFAHELAQKHWPWPARPEVYYDPRALSTETDTRACLHAKFIAIDRTKLLITSANFTEAAQRRNIEVGVIVQSPDRASQLIEYFAGLRSSGQLVRLVW